MGLFDPLLNLFKKKDNKTDDNLGNYHWIEASKVQDVFTYDYVISAIRVICEEISKMIIKSVTKKNNIVNINNDSITRLFENRPNELMTTKDMLHWTAYNLETRSNAYWLPVFEITKFGDSTVKKKLVSIYPINSIQEQIIFSNNEYYLIFTMQSGSTFKVKYKEVIHFRKDYGSSYHFGKQNRETLLARLNIITQIEELLPKAVNASMLLKGVVTAKSQMAADSLEKFKNQVEESFSSSENGLAAIGTDGEFKQLSANPQIIDKDTLSYLKQSVNEDFGVSEQIIKGEGTEDNWNALYQRNIEPFKIALEQAATTVLFTETEISHGNRIKVYDKLVQNLPMKTRLEMIKLMGPSGYLSRSEQRELLGYEPDGKEDRVSLNYVNEQNLDQYQLTKKEKSKEDQQ